MEPTDNKDLLKYVLHNFVDWVQNNGSCHFQVSFRGSTETCFIQESCER